MKLKQQKLGLLFGDHVVSKPLWLLSLLSLLKTQIFSLGTFEGQTLVKNQHTHVKLMGRISDVKDLPKNSIQQGDGHFQHVIYSTRVTDDLTGILV